MPLTVRRSPLRFTLALGVLTLTLFCGPVFQVHQERHLVGQGLYPGDKPLAFSNGQVGLCLHPEEADATGQPRCPACLYFLRAAGASLVPPETLGQPEAGGRPVAVEAAGPLASPAFHVSCRAPPSV